MFFIYAGARKTSCHPGMVSNSFKFNLNCLDLERNGRYPPGLLSIVHLVNEMHIKLYKSSDKYLEIFSLLAGLPAIFCRVRVGD